MNKVYIVTAGEYSGYKIVRVFAEEAVADKFIAVAENEECTIEEWDLLSALPPQVNLWTKTSTAAPEGSKLFAGRYEGLPSPDGDEYCTVLYPDEDADKPFEHQKASYWDPKRIEVRIYQRPCTSYESRAPIRVDVVDLEVRGSDLERVRHVFNDERAKLKIALDELAAS